MNKHHRSANPKLRVKIQKIKAQWWEFLSELLQPPEYKYSEVREQEPGESKRLLFVCSSNYLPMIHCIFTNVDREKEGDLTQSYDKNPYTNRKFENQKPTQKRH